MLHIIWLILKIIGIVLLCVLALLLLILAVVLFVPVRYRAAGSYHGQLKAVVKATWLLHSLSVKAVYDGDLDFGVRIFGFSVLKPGSKEEEEAEEEMVLRTQELMEELEEDLTGAIEEEPAPKQDVKKEEQAGKEQKQERRREEKKAPPKEPEPGPAGRFERIRASLAAKIAGVKESFENLKINLDKAKEFFQDEENKKTIRLVWKNAKALLKHIMPRKMKGEVVFGFDDPYITGQILTVAGALYPLYGKSLRVCPLFDCTELVLEAELDLKGRIRLGTVLYHLIRVYCNKNFRVLLKKWRS